MRQYIRKGNAEKLPLSLSPSRARARSVVDHHRRYELLRSHTCPGNGHHGPRKPAGTEERRLLGAAASRRDSARSTVLHNNRPEPGKRQHHLHMLRHEIPQPFQSQRRHIVVGKPMAARVVASRSDAILSSCIPRARQRGRGGRCTRGSHRRMLAGRRLLRHPVALRANHGVVFCL